MQPVNTIWVLVILVDYFSPSYSKWSRFSFLFLVLITQASEVCWLTYYKLYENFMFLIFQIVELTLSFTAEIYYHQPMI